MKKNNLYAVIIITFNVIIILFVKCVLSKKTNYKIALNYQIPPRVAYRRCARPSYDNSIKLSREKRYQIRLKTSNDEIMNLIELFLGGDKNDNK